MHPVSPKNLIPLDENLANEKNDGSCETTFTPERKPNNSYPIFAVEDDKHSKFQEWGICDEKFNPLPQYEKVLFPVLSSIRPEDRPTLLSILDFFSKVLTIQSQHDDPSVQPFKIAVSLRELVDYLRKASQIPFCDPETKVEGIFPVERASLIGQHLIETVGMYPFEKLCKELFSDLPSEAIKELFQLPYVQAFFNQKANDMDLRIQSKGSLQYQSHLSELILLYLVDRMKDFNAEKYYELLKKKNPMYSHRELSLSDLKRYSLLEFGGITKRKIVDEKKTQYVIFGIKTDDRSFELIFVGTDTEASALHLESPCLSSRDCFSVDLLPFFEDKKGIELSIETAGFSPAKAMIDLLTNSSSTDADHNGWLRYLKYFRRFTLQGMEARVLRRLFSRKASSQSESSYLFSQIEKEMEKKGTTDPFLTLQYLLRASLSVHEHYPINECEITRLWELMDQGNYLKFDPQENSHALGIALKKALIDQKIPFSIVYSWLGMIGFLAFPKTYTSLGWAEEGPTHAFQFMYPFCIRVAAIPADQSYAVFSSLQKNPDYLPALMQIYYSLESHSEKIAFPSPLQGCCKVNFDMLIKEADKWFDQPDSALHLLGVRIYLAAASEGITNGQIYALFSYLPKILTGTESTKVKKDILDAIDALFQKFPSYHDDWEVIKENAHLATEEFIKVLVKAQKKTLAQFALRLWEELDSASKETNTLIFKVLIFFDPQRALEHVQKMMTTAERFEGFCLLAARSQKQLEVPFQFHELIPLLTTLVDSASSLKKEEKTEIAKKIYPILKRQCLSIGEALLLKASEAGLIEPNDHQDFWLTFLEGKVDSDSTNSIGALYYTMIEKGFINGIYNKNPRLHEFKIKLGKRLLLEKENVFSHKLLQELIKSPLKSSMLEPLYDLLYSFLINKLEHPCKELLPLLKHLVQITPKDKVTGTTGLIGLLCDNVKDSLLFPSIDELLVAPQTIELLKEDKSARASLLSYLEATMKTSPRFPSVWALFDKILNLPGDRSKEQGLQVLKIGSKLLQQDEPSSEIKEWLKEKHLSILPYLIKSECFEEGYVYVTTLNAYKLASSESFQLPLWQICQHFLQDPQASYNKLRALFQLEKPNFFLKFIKSTDHPSLLVFFHQLRSHKEIVPAAEWARACLDLPCNNEELDLMEQNRFSCIDQLIDTGEKILAFELLKAAQPISKNRDVYRNYWITLTISLQSVVSLETRKILFLSDLAKDVLSGHTDLLKEYAAKEAETFLDSPHLYAEELISLCEFYHLHDENLCQRLLTALKGKDSKELLERCIRFCPTHSLKAQCWVLYLKCLRRISDPEILSYFDSPTLKAVFFDASNEKREADRELILAQIGALSRTAFDQGQYEKIIALDSEWDLEIEKALIFQLQNTIQKTCYQALCKRLIAIISHFHENKDTHGVFVTAIECVIKNGRKEGFNEEIAELLKAIHLQQEYPIDSCFKILQSLQHSDYTPSELLYPLLVRIFKSENLQLVKQLKVPFISLFPLSLKTNSLTAIKKSEKLLYKSIKSIKFLDAEKAGLVDAFLTHFFSFYNQNEAIVEEETDRALNTYVRWVPFLFERPDLLKKHLEQIVKISFLYADPNHFDQADLLEFSKCLRAIIQIKFHQSLSQKGALKLQETRNMYLKWCMQFWKEIKLQKAFFGIALYNLILEHIRGTLSNVSIPDILEEIEEYALFFPVQPNNKLLESSYLLVNDTQIENEIPYDSTRDLNILVMSAFNKRMFDTNLKKFCEYIIRSTLATNTYPEEVHKVPYGIFIEVAEDVISRLLSDPNPRPTSVLYSYMIFCTWFGNHRKEHGKVYFLKFKEIAKYCHHFPLVVADKTSFLWKLYEITLVNFTNDSSLSSPPDEQLLEMTSVLLDYAWKIYEEMKNSTHPIEYSIHYLQLCVDLVEKHLSFQGNKRDYILLEEFLLKLMPEIIYLETKEWDLNENLPLTIYEETTLTKKFVFLINEFDKSHTNSMTRKQGQKLAISWVESLIEIDSKNNLELIYQSLAILMRTPLFTSELEEAAACFDRALKCFPPSENSFDYEYLQLDFRLKEHLKDYPAYLNYIQDLMTKVLETKRFFCSPLSLYLLGEFFINLPERPSDVDRAQRNFFFNEFFKTMNAEIKNLSEKEYDILTIKAKRDEILTQAKDAGVTFVKERIDELNEGLTEEEIFVGEVFLG